MIDAIEANCSLFSTIDVPVVKINSDGTGTGIAFSLTPVGQEIRYMDGSRLRNYSFQIMVRHTDQPLILETLYTINRFVDGLKADDIQSNNGTFEFNSVMVTSVPNLIQVDAHGCIYVSSFQAELLLLEN